MAENEPAPPDALSPPAKEGGGALWEIVAILVAIAIGVAVGWFYGRTMWLASGGASEAVETLEKTLEQKKAFAAKEATRAEEADAAGHQKQATIHRNEAQRLLGHIPTIEMRLEASRTIVRNAQAAEGQAWHTTALYVYEFTRFLGEMFLRGLTLLVIPLVVTSMICGVTSLGDVRKLGRLGGWTVGYYMLTTGVAVLIGLALVSAIRPGVGADDTFAYVKKDVEEKQDSTLLGTLLDVFRGKADESGRRPDGEGMFPKNLVAAASTTNVLGLIAFSLLFGGALTMVGPVGRTAIEFFRGANEAVMKIVELVMFVAPLGIYGLVASEIAKNGGAEGVGEELRRLSWYAATVMIGLGIHAVFLANVLWLGGRRNPFLYTRNVLRALLTAMSTSSSSATLPVTLECVEEDNGVSEKSAGFVLPLGATINMDGTALYEAVAVIFIAQSIGMGLTAGQLLIIFLTATLAAVGAAGIPSAGLVTMVLVLNAAGVPMSGIGAILAIDWFLDRLRTTVNVYGDTIGAAVIDQRVLLPQNTKLEQQPEDPL